MKEFTYTITDPNGIHARPAGLLVKQLKAFKSTVTIFKGDKNVDMKKLLALMGLGVKQGDAVAIKVEGEDEEACAAALEKFLKETF
jgi:phosphocarrier,  HPr family